MMQLPRYLFVLCLIGAVALGYLLSLPPEI